MVALRHLAVALLSAACASTPEAPPAPQPPAAPASPEAERARKEAQLAEAEAALAQDPKSEDAWIWVGRRLAYLERFDEAQATYARALEVHPRSWKVLRHRGHRWITLRRFDRALDDLSRAWVLCRELPDEVEPDGQPNAAGVPIGSIQSNILYHLALAHYLRCEWAAAASVWDQSRELNSSNDDRLCSSAYWNYLALRRAGLDERAKEVVGRVREPLTILENESYRDLCFLFRGERSAEDVLRGIAPGTTDFATRGYGVGCWHLLRAEREAARALFEQIVATGPKNAFGCIAAEMELAR